MSYCYFNFTILTVVCQVSSSMFLYIIENVDNGLIKIGYSLTPQRRCASLQTGSSAELRVAYTVAVAENRARLLEQRMHRDINHYRVRGEWFSVPLAEAIALLDHCVIRWHDDSLLD